jgi:hypothetical protein
MPITGTDVRKALEDLVYANLVVMFMVKSGTAICVAGVDKSVSFPTDGFNGNYDNATDYILNIVEAVDVDGIDLTMAIEVKGTTENGFVLNSPRNTSVKWYSMRRTPKFDTDTLTYWT